MVRGILFELGGASTRAGGRRMVRWQLPEQTLGASTESVIRLIPIQIEPLSCRRSVLAGDNEEQEGLADDVLECSPPGSQVKE